MDDRVGAAARAFDDRIARIVHVIGVIALAAVHRVGTLEAVQHVVAGVAVERVVQRIARGVGVELELCIDGGPRPVAKIEVLDFVGQDEADGGIDRVGAFPAASTTVSPALETK